MQLCKKCLEVFGAEVHFSYRLLKGDLKRIRKRLNLNKPKMKLLLIINLPLFLFVGFVYPKKWQIPKLLQPKH